MVRQFWRHTPAVAAIVAPTPPAAATPEVELVAFSENAELRGYVRLSGMRLTDALNSGAPITIWNAVLLPLGSDSAYEVHELVVCARRAAHLVRRWRSRRPGPPASDPTRAGRIPM
jgi:hypothetical protein